MLHTLDLSVNDGVLKQSRVSTIVKTCQSIVSHQHSSSKGTEAFIKKQMEIKGCTRSQCLSLVGYVKTRWNSVYLMLKRFITLKHVVQLFLPEEKIPVHGATNVHYKLDDSDFVFMSRVTTLLKPFFELTQKFSSNKISIAEVIPNILTLKIYLEKSKAEQVGTLKANLLDSVNCRFFGTNADNNILKNPVFTNPTILHPKNRKVYQRFARPEDFEQAKGNLLKELLKISSDQDDDSNSISSLGEF